MALSAAISVIVPVRDARATLPETLDSLRGQTFSEWQAVVLDDASSDGSRELAERFAAADSRVKLRRLEGRGAGPARNEGLRAAEGAWTLFLDADDLLAPEALERLHLEASRHPDLDAVYC